ncbi:MAG: LysR substrate-binding domain-containing protein [Sphingobium sp.]|jgi:DNA-binding transcriptional LysR family regulator|nr:LysR substrate-binding domain-containing protein [Sphingobium sp.]MCI1754641.1 LysR substrate-binding domain-containing protein [Sphingobium sp.]MCI2054181.1 LysR substrate-binding domain-containing protein [Sphingobium sp.]
MDLRQLRYFLVLSEELNFTRAAQRCNISQPPLSRAIAQLEDELSAPLFVRNTHHVTLTPAGQGLVEDARRLLSSVEDAADKARRTARGQRGTLKLGFGGSTVYSLWPRLLEGFRAEAPDVRIVFASMSVLEQIEALREGQIDLGLIRLPIMDEMLTAEVVYHEGLSVALPSAHHLCATDGAISIGQLAADRFVAYEPRRGFRYHADLHALCQSADFVPNIAHEASSTEAVVGIVACDACVAVVPSSAERLRMHGVSFRSLKISSNPQPFESVTFGLAWKRDAPSQVTMEFVAHARTKIGLLGKLDSGEIS